MPKPFIVSPAIEYEVFVSGASVRWRTGREFFSSRIAYQQQISPLPFHSIAATFKGPERLALGPFAAPSVGTVCVGSRYNSNNNARGGGHSGGGGGGHGGAVVPKYPLMDRYRRK